MRICIFGAGAVGSHFAVRLALAGHEVSCVMRGLHLKAVQAGGLTLRVASEEFSAKVKAFDDPTKLGPQDVVISTLKANGLASLVTGLPPLPGSGTAIVFAQHGDIGLAADQPPPPPAASWKTKDTPRSRANNLMSYMHLSKSFGKHDPGDEALCLVRPLPQWVDIRVAVSILIKPCPQF